MLRCRYELGRQPANTKLSSNVAVRRVRVRGGNFKFRALRLDAGNFSWGSEVRGGVIQLWPACAGRIAGCGLPQRDVSLLQAVTRKTRVLDVVYNASNNELVSDWWHGCALLAAVAGCVNQ